VWFVCWLAGWLSGCSVAVDHELSVFEASFDSPTNEVECPFFPFFFVFLALIFRMIALCVCVCVYVCMYGKTGAVWRIDSDDYADYVLPATATERSHDMFQLLFHQYLFDTLQSPDK